MADEISDLRLFVRMVAAGSLAETARRLNSSLPAMSRRLAAMENRLGVRLVQRSPRRFVLTEEGGLLHERALVILEDIDRAEAEVGDRTESPRGHIRVGAPYEIGRRRIAPLIGAFCERYPNVSVELVLSDARTDIMGANLHVALLVDQPDDGDLVSRLLLRSRRVVCAAPSYLERHGCPQTPADLLQHNCLLMVRGHEVYDRWTFADGGEPMVVQVRGSLSSSNAEVVHDWAISGHGVGLKALWDIEEDLAEGRLVELLAPFSCNVINLYAIYPTRTHLPIRVRLFIDHMSQALRGSRAFVP